MDIKRRKAPRNARRRIVRQADRWFAQSYVVTYRIVRPSTIEQALGYCDDLLGQKHCEIVEPGDRHWAIFSRLCIEAGTKGPMVIDAWFAALAIEHGCTWVTYDRDYARFPELDWREPAA